MELSQATIGLLLIVALVSGVLGLLVAGVALGGQRRVQRAYRVFAGGSRDDVLTILQRHIEEVQGLRRETTELRARTDLLRGSISRVATVRYDAFDDMGGHLSYSIALLDERGDGVVLTAINGRTDTRCYAKAIVGGESRHHLSEEEAAAVREALAPRPRMRVAEGRRRTAS